MTDLLKDLEAVVGLCDKASAMLPSADGNAAIAEAEAAATNWLITHHAEIAEAVRKAAEGGRNSDSKRLQYVLSRVGFDATGPYLPCGNWKLDDLDVARSRKNIDAAIDAQNNSAREG